jgi:plasmid replication initiation protein
MGGIFMSIENNHLVEKRNVLNEMRPKEGMKLQELRFFLIYLSKINARDINTRIVHFQLSDFQEIVGIEKPTIPHFKAVVDELLSKVIFIPTESGGFNAFQIFKKCKLDRDKNDEWFFEIDAHDDALPLMFEIKDRYFKYEIWNALKLKSSNQVRMYELLKQHEQDGEVIFKIEDLKFMLGFEKKEYKAFQDFKKRVLEPSKAALAENTDITFEYLPHKRKKAKILSLRFMISENRHFSKPNTTQEFLMLSDGTNIKPENLNISAKDIITQNNDIKKSNHRTKISTKFKGENTIKEYSIKQYDHDILLDIAEWVNYEFSNEQCQYLHDLISEKSHIDKHGVKTENTAYLQEKYHEMCMREPKRNRFAYLCAIIKAENKS